MKKFSFPLARVLAWRQTEARIEENKLERLNAELRVLEGRNQVVTRERQSAVAAVASASGVEGWRLAQLDQFQISAAAEQRRLTASSADCRDRIAEQTRVVAAKRRDAKLLQKLREQRVESWTSDYHREIDQQAEESFLARWSKR